MTDRELMQRALDALEQIRDAKVQRLELLPVYHETIEALKSRLAQPEPEPVAWYYAGSDVEWHSIALDADLDDAQKANCTPLYTAPPQRNEVDSIAKMREMLEVQGRSGTWDYDHYFHGMYNGMEFMLALAEGREPVFRGAPEKWLSAPPKKEWVGLTGNEYEAIAEQHVTNCYFDTLKYAHAIEVKLKEKNT